MKRLVFAVLLACAAQVSAWPFGPNPQCGPLPTCSDGCYAPNTEKCALWAAEQVESGAAQACGLGGACQ
ncbi:MAG TPA: hypothetical protein VJ725_07285 [Thermoanaerobaculia bacterium]|nr:hypothetical protein [Thermoanaerobaculia bacterium]